MYGVMLQTDINFPLATIGSTRFVSANRSKVYFELSGFSGLQPRKMSTFVQSMLCLAIGYEF